MNWALSFLGPQFTSVQTEEAEILELTSCGSTSRTWGLPPMCLSILNSVWSLAGLGEGRVDGGDHGDWRPGRAQLSGTMKIHPLKQYLALGAGTGRAQAVLGMQVVDQLLHGISWVMAYYLIGNSSCFFPSFFSPLFSLPTPPPEASLPVEKNQEAMRKLGTISSFISSKELEEEVSGRKDVKVDKNLRDSWKYSREQGWEARSKQEQDSRYG